MMEFEQMQIIWNSQNDEKLFAIDEAALHRVIKGKSRATGRWLGLMEAVMMGVNLIVGIMLLVDAIQDTGTGAQFVIAAMYFAYAIFAVYRRRRRRREEIRFAETMLGDLDKAIWRIDYLIRQGRGLVMWYLLPLLLVAAVTLWLAGRGAWALAVVFVLLPLGAFGARWEINKWHLPKKRSLESLRETLTGSPS